MENERTPVDRLLESLGIESMCEWDVLVFLYRHQSTLAGAEYIAHLLGYDANAVIAAMKSLESKGLVGRSRVHRGTRLYQLEPSENGFGSPQFDQLINWRHRRSVRLLLRKGRSGLNTNGLSGRGGTPPVAEKE